ncbi:MAG: tetratricopeptide repeat protein [Proteobacteria bacterium]|nr:tetratricopeptide repeat protein [Pseudomonadota bacterium]
MKLILFFLFLVIGVSSFGLLYLKDPGLIEIIWLGYEVQLTAVLAFLILFTAFFVFVLCAWGASWFLGIPYRWFIFLKRWKKRKAEDILIDLLTSSEAETFDDALQQQKKTEKELHDNPIFLWISANLFEKAEQHFDAEKYFVELTKNPSTSFLGLKGCIRSAMHRSDFKTANDLLKRIVKLSPTSPWVLKNKLALARHGKKFEETETLILRLEDLGYLPSKQSKQQVAYVQYQQALEPKTSSAQKEVFLRQAHFLDPSLAQATEMLAELFHEQGHTTYALNAIETTWQVNPTRYLADLYLKITASQDNLNTFQEAQQLVKENPTHSESLLLLSRTAIDAQLWGEARGFLSSLLKENPTADVYQLLARLELKDKQDWKAALIWLEKGLQAPRHV